MSARKSGPRAKYATMAGRPPTSRYKGVSAAKARWCVRITVGGKTRNVGSYGQEIEAARAFDVAALEHFGDDAITNASLGLLGGDS